MARLTIPDEQTFATFTVVTSTSAFPITFSLFAKADLTVLVDDVALDQSAFTFAGTALQGGGYDGGTVTLNSAVDDVTVRIERNVAPARTSNFAPASSVPVQTVDLAINRATAIQQDHKRRLGVVEDAIDDADGSVAASVAAAAASASSAAGSASTATTQAGIATTAAAGTAGGVAAAAASASAAASSASASAASATAAAASALAALNAQTQAELAALVSGNTIYTTMPTAPFTGVPSPFLYSTSAGVQVYTHDGATATLVGWLGRVSFSTVAELLAFTGPLSPVGTIVYAGRFRYETVASGAHVTTAGGSLLTVKPGETGYDIAAFGADMTGVASGATAWTACEAAASADGLPMIVSKGTVRLTGSLTVTADLTVVKGGIIQIDSGTLTINGVFSAKRWNVFTGAGTGPAFGPGSVDAIFPEWFGCRTRISSGTPVDCSVGVLATLNASSRSLVGTVHRVSFGHGIYDLATEISIPGGGLFQIEGQGLGTQVRGMSPWPEALFSFTSSSTDSRITSINFMAGSTSRPVKYGVRANTVMVHTNFHNCKFGDFEVAGIYSADWTCTYTNVVFSECGAGIWFGASANNNDHTVFACKFLKCGVGAATGPGANIRFIGCQFQGGTNMAAGKWTRTHVYVYGGTGVHFDNCYFETQSGGGLMGMTFTVPETVTIYADIIYNGLPYYSDTAGTLVTTLAQDSAAGGTTGSIRDCNFASPAYWLAGAGGTGYTAGAVTLTATNGNGSGASATAAVTSGAVSSLSAITGGTDWQIGDRFVINQGGNVTASGTVLSTTTNNAISTITIGGNAAVYPGNCKALTISNCQMGNGYFVLYNDSTYCNPRRVLVQQTVKGSGDADFLVLGANTTQCKVPFRNFVIDNMQYLEALDTSLGAYNYFTGYSFASAPTLSSFTRSATRNKGYPFYTFALLAGNQTSDTMTGSFAVSTSTTSPSDLRGKRIYFSVLKNNSGTDVKLRLTLSVASGTSTITRENVSTSTTFTGTSGEGREEVSIVVPTSTSTVTWTMQVISSSAGSQSVDITAPVIAMVGVPAEAFPRWTFDAPLTGSATYDPGSLATNTSEATATITVYGARLGDQVRIAPPYTLSGLVATGYVSANNTVTIVVENPTAGTVNLGSGTWRAFVTPST